MSFISLHNITDKGTNLILTVVIQYIHCCATNTQLLILVNRLILQVHRMLCCLQTMIHFFLVHTHLFVCSQVDMRIQDEDLRTRKFFHPVSYSRVIRECEACMVEEYIPYLQVECRLMVKEENKPGRACEG